MAEGTLSPRSLKVVRETDWKDPASIARLEGLARDIFCTLLVGAGENPAAEEEKRARTWAVGAIASAVPRAEREAIRPLIVQLVEKATAPQTPAPS